MPTIQNTNLFAALDTRRKKKSDKAKASSVIKEPEPQVFWSPTPLKAKAWTDIDSDDEDDDYFATTAPPPPQPLWSASNAKEVHVEELLSRELPKAQVLEPIAGLTRLCSWRRKSRRNGWLKWSKVFSSPSCLFSAVVIISSVYVSGQEMAARNRPAAVKPEFEVATCDQKDEYILRFLPRQGKADKKTEHCIICLDDVDSDLMCYIERCGHRFCVNCAKQHIQVKLADQKIPDCPHHRCIVQLSIDRCGDLLTNKQSLVWMQRIKEYSTPLADRVYCPYESCSHLMSTTELSRGGSSSGLRRCFRCRGEFCVHCSVPWHGKLSCNDYRRLYPNRFHGNSDDAKLKSLANLKGWRQCPKCYHMVARSYGCNRITCRCGNVFCYKCGYLWDFRFHGDCNNDFISAFILMIVLVSLVLLFGIFAITFFVGKN